MYKIQVYSGLQTFTKEEKEKLKIVNLGEYEFLESEKTEREEKKINISQRIGNILKESQEWNNAMDNIVMPIIKKFEYKFSESEATDSNDKKDASSNSTESNGVSNFGKEGIEISPSVIRRNRTPPPSPIKNKARRNMLMKERMNSRRKKYVVEEDFFGENEDNGDKKENDTNNGDNKNGDNIDEINNTLEKNKSLESKEIKKEFDKEISNEKEEENKLINNNIEVNKLFDISEEKITFDLPKNRDKNVKSEPKRRVNINNDRRRRKMKTNKAYDDADFWED
jgi:hypothetical protein